ncbi:uncharacterized protein LOC119437342 isoform X3 [Dermacentor silvarum]|uniref:uncharacterized protein LOC119437342 isoform X2 n=1 Tax=Dermacentor silvarum TaxID=543639 RepID=UPI001897E4EE|nr:uncharacterized protein LOC119437342 isoform X2 [Dermacentor silvarum]XP_049516405.1 uncharacterized protein LOC119437342 isoform X3 [Dermacentor silvarum]
MDKTPYVLLERIDADSQRAFEHGLQQIPIAKRRPIVLVEKLPVAVTYGLRQSGDNPSGQPARKIPKRKLSPGPSRRPCPDTPSKHVCCSTKCSRKYPRMRLWTGPKSNGRQKTGSAKEKRPIVLEKLPLAVTYGLRQSGDNPSGQPARKIPKRKLSPGPSSMDQTPYVLLERINADSQRAFEHGLQQIPIAQRRPIVLVEKLPLAVTYGLRQSGDNPSGQPARKIPKRKLSPGPSGRPCPDTPSKHVCCSTKCSRKYPRMRLWTGPKSNGRQKTGSAKENGTSQYYSHKSLWEDQAQSSVQSAISSVKSANLAVLLGVRSRGVPVVKLERLQTDSVQAL